MPANVAILSTACAYSFPQPDLHYLLFPTFVVFFVLSPAPSGFHENLTFHVCHSVYMFFRNQQMKYLYEHFTNMKRGGHRGAFVCTSEVYQLIYSKHARPRERQHSCLAPPSSLQGVGLVLNMLLLAARGHWSS